MTFQLYTVETAPLESKENLRQIKADNGFIPNIAKVFAGAPQVLEAYMTLGELVENVSFSPVEREAILITIALQNGSAYCTAVHSLFADKLGLATDIIEDLHTEGPVDDPKLEALRRYTQAVMENRGRPPDDIIDSFLAAGYKPTQALEIVLCIAYMTLTSYTNRLAHPPLDDQFRSKFPEQHINGGREHREQRAATP
jgi:alkylhydroperoxidase family enzyme